jgi:hypothetical protein
MFDSLKSNNTSLTGTFTQWKFDPAIVAINATCILKPLPSRDKVSCNIIFSDEECYGCRNSIEHEEGICFSYCLNWQGGDTCLGYLAEAVYYDLTLIPELYFGDVITSIANVRDLNDDLVDEIAIGLPSYNGMINNK